MKNVASDTYNNTIHLIQVTKKIVALRPILKNKLFNTAISADSFTASVDTCRKAHKNEEVTARV